MHYMYIYAMLNNSTIYIKPKFGTLALNTVDYNAKVVAIRVSFTEAIAIVRGEGNKC